MIGLLLRATTPTINQSIPGGLRPAHETLPRHCVRSTITLNQAPARSRGAKVCNKQKAAHTSSQQQGGRSFAAREGRLAKGGEEAPPPQAGPNPCAAAASHARVRPRIVDHTFTSGLSGSYLGCGACWRPGMAPTSRFRPCWVRGRGETLCDCIDQRGHSRWMALLRGGAPIDPGRPAPTTGTVGSICCVPN